MTRRRAKRHQTKRNGRTQSSAAKQRRPTRTSFTETMPSQRFKLPTIRLRRGYLLRQAISRGNIEIKFVGDALANEEK